MTDKSIKVGGCEAFTVDGAYLSIFTGDYEYGCSMQISEWEAVKTAIDNMIAEVSNETNPATTCREVPTIHGQENQSE
ncbi:hypothetical protein ACS8E2_05575 [Psychrobacter glaciei]|uniref:hypothetical protein n=1 Tax=Psychrobacter glaciei TaxID=619771 RepID=UPI003F473AB2